MILFFFIQISDQSKTTFNFKLGLFINFFINSSTEFLEYLNKILS